MFYLPLMMNHGLQIMILLTLLILNKNQYHLKMSIID